MLDNRIVDLFNNLMSGKITVVSFCDTFEILFNFEIDKSLLNGIELENLSDLFDIVVWYSPLPEERLSIPNYKDEESVISAAQRAASALRIS